MKIYSIIFIFLSLNYLSAQVITGADSPEKTDLVFFSEDWEGSISGWSTQQGGDKWPSDPIGTPGYNSNKCLYGSLLNPFFNDSHIGFWAYHSLSGMSGVRKIYFSQWTKWSSDYQFSGAGTKFMYVWTNTCPVMLKLVGGDPYIRVKECAVDLTLYTGSADVWTGQKIAPRGEWHHVEYMVELNTSGANGNIEVWYDGELIAAWYNRRLSTDNSTFAGVSTVFYWTGGDIGTGTYEAWADDIMVTDYRVGPQGGGGTKNPTQVTGLRIRK